MNKYLFERHNGEDVVETEVCTTPEGMEAIAKEASIGCDKVLVYTLSDSIVCGYEKGVRINFTTEYVTE